VYLTGRGEQLLMGQLVSTNYFATLGVVPAVGRGFLPEEEFPGATPVAVISHAVWLRLFDGRPDVTLPAVLAAVDVAACWIPAIRATRIDRSVALCDE
jgi:hypothetical protein